MKMTKILNEGWAFTIPLLLSISEYLVLNAVVMPDVRMPLGPINPICKS